MLRYHMFINYISIHFNYTYNKLLYFHRVYPHNTKMCIECCLYLSYSYSIYRHTSLKSTINH